MVKYTIPASLVFVQLAIVAQTSFGLPVDSSKNHEADVQRLDQRDLDKRKPLGPLSIGLGVLAVAAGGVALYEHIKHKKADGAAKVAANAASSAISQRDDFEKRRGDYEVVEGRNYGLDQLDELN